MNVLIYIPNIKQDDGGVRQYAVSLLKILSNDKLNNYYILHNINDLLLTNVIVDSKNLFLIPKKIGKESRLNKFLRLGTEELNLILKKLYPQFQVKNYSYLDHICKKYKISVAYCPYQCCPPTNYVKTICTMHDVQELHFPEYFTPSDRAYRANAYNRAMKKADKILVSYNHIKNDIKRYFPDYLNKTSVCLLDMNYLWFNSFTSSTLSDDLALKIPTEFILYPANSWPHKNHLRLIEAIAFLKNQRGLKVNLVCTGSKSEHFFSEIEPLIKELKIEDQITFTGLVSEQNLFNIYNRAKGVVIPTKYEAGSYPLMESMILQIPVICSDVTSLPETIRNPLFVFNPDNVGDIAEKCALLYADADFRLLNIKNSKKNVGFFLQTGALENIQNTLMSLSRNS